MINVCLLRCQSCRLEASLLFLPCFITFNWLTGSDCTAKNQREAANVGTFLYLPAFPPPALCKLSPPLLHCQRSYKGPPGARAGGSVPHVLTRACTSGAGVMNRGVWKSPYHSGAHVLRCVCLGECSGEPAMRKQSSRLPSSLPSLSR